MNTARQFFLMSLVLILVTSCAQQQPAAPAPEAPSPVKPVATTLDIMESLISYMAADIFASVGTIIDEKGQHEIVPADDAAWTNLRFQAMGLAETGNLLMMKPRAVDDGDWIKISQAMIEKSLSAARAAEDKDPEAMLVAGGEIYETCQACHMKYNPDEPIEE